MQLVGLLPEELTEVWGSVQQASTPQARRLPVPESHRIGLHGTGDSPQDP